MELKTIKNNKQYETYLNWVDKMFDKKIKANTPEGEALQIVLLLIKDYEDKHYQIPSPDPISAIRLKMEEKGLKNKDLVPFIGSKSYVSQILSGTKPLTLDVVKNLHKLLGIPAEVLLA